MRSWGDADLENILPLGNTYGVFTAKSVTFTPVLDLTTALLEYCKSCNSIFSDADPDGIIAILDFAQGNSGRKSGPVQIQIGSSILGGNGIIPDGRGIKDIAGLG